jgi:hypothetical protein
MKYNRPMTLARVRHLTATATSGPVDVIGHRSLPSCPNGKFCIPEPAVSPKAAAAAALAPDERDMHAELALRAAVLREVVLPCLDALSADTGRAEAEVS